MQLFSRNVGNGSRSPDLLGDFFYDNANVISN